jgi:hypothetical protein
MKPNGRLGVLACEAVSPSGSLIVSYFDQFRKRINSKKKMSYLSKKIFFAISERTVDEITFFSSNKLSPLSSLLS